MKTILETVQLEFNDSDYLIDLVTDGDSNVYIEIVQTILNSDKIAESIKINSSILSDIINVLQNYHAKLPEIVKSDRKHITETEQDRIKEIYLKGIPIRDIAMQLGQTPELIEMILRNKGFEIVENIIPKPKFHKKTYKRRKKRR